MANDLWGWVKDRYAAEVKKQEEELLRRLKEVETRTEIDTSKREVTYYFRNHKVG